MRSRNSVTAKAPERSDARRKRNSQYGHRPMDEVRLGASAVGAPLSVPENDR